jgi:AraC-like DNA-binding protein
MRALLQATPTGFLQKRRTTEMRRNSTSKKLAAVDNWPKRAKDAGYCAQRLARALRQDERTLRRFFAKRFGRSTHQQLESFRQLEATQLAKSGVQAKVIAIDLNFKNASHFSQRFKAYHGVSFRLWLKSVQRAPQPPATVLSEIHNFKELPSSQIKLQGNHHQTEDMI